MLFVINIDHFHLFNGTSDYTESSKTNESYFKDMGPIYDGSELGRGKSKTFLMIFKVKRNINFRKNIINALRINIIGF